MRSRVAGVVLVSSLALPGLASPSTELKATGLSAPMHFERNDGQADASVRYLARGRGYTLFLTDSEAVVSGGREDALRLRFVGGKGRLEAEPAPGVTNYLVGAPSRWRTGIPHFSRVTYREVYPGVSLTYYGQETRAEYDIAVAPRANPNRIRMRFEGAEGVSIGADGAVHARTKNGEFVQHAPVAYQLEGEERQPVRASYVLSNKGEVRLALGRYDRTRPLVIDPVLSYSTFPGAPGGAETKPAIATDAEGNVYLTGTTLSTSTPTNTDAVVVKMSRTGTPLFSTYLGGTGDDAGAGIAVDGSGNVYVVGRTGGSFPLEDPLQQAYGGGTSDAFLAILTPSLTLTYSSYLGGSGDDAANGVVVDNPGRVYVAGRTGGSFPLASALQQTYGGGTNDAFLTVFTPSPTPPPALTLTYSSYLGGTGDDRAAGLAVDGTGAVTVVGSTSADFPVANAPQPTAGGLGDGFVFRIENPTTAPTVSFSTYLGGAGADGAAAVAIGPGDALDVTGFTESENFPIANSEKAQQPASGGGRDAFLAVYEEGASGYALDYSTYLGGSGTDAGTAIGVDAAGRIYLAGTTLTGAVETAFPRRFSRKEAAAGDQDAFVSKLDITGPDQIRYSTLLGGPEVEGPPALAVHPTALGVAYVAGGTLSDEFPVTDGTSRPHAGYSTMDLFALELVDGDPGSDFNADFKWDLLWFQNSTGAIWLSNGLDLLGGELLPTVAGGWEPAGAGDFDGDDKVDILWRNADDGQNAVWGMNGTIIASADLLATVQPPWTMDLVGDFDGDGREDIFWRQPQAGDNAIWFMDGAQVKSAGLTTSLTDLNWMVVEAADFNGDGKADILWRNVQTGDNAVWFMDGLAIANAKMLDSRSMSWSIPAAADLDGDGKADVLWRNAETEEAAVWFMDGMSDPTEADLPTVAATWEAIAAGDFDGDGKGDILWRDGTTGETAGQTAVWFMDGSTISQTTQAWGTVNGWQVVAPRARTGGSVPVATPQFVPEPNQSTAQVGITTATPGAVIRYTVSTDPQVEPGPPDTSPNVLLPGQTIAVGSYAKIRAKAYRFWTLPSAEVSAEYWYVAPPTFSEPRNLPDPFPMTIGIPGGTRVFYTTTTDGSEPPEPVWGGTEYITGQQITISVTTRFKARAFSDEQHGSATVEATYIVGVDAPTFTPPPGSYPRGTTISITSRTEGAVIHYRIDGGEPGTTDPVVNGPITVGDYTLTAKAFRDGWSTPSPTTAGTYAVTTPLVPRVAAGRDHSLGLASDGTVWAWGYGGYGQLGLGEPCENKTTPTQVASLSRMVAVDGGLYYSIALGADGTVWGWGDNGEGQLGDGTDQGHSTPVPIRGSGMPAILAVSAGEHHTLALAVDGTVWGWGLAAHSQLGDEECPENCPTNHLTPVRVPNLESIVAIAAGYRMSVAVKSDGTVWAWGTGALGGGAIVESSTPVQIHVFDTQNAAVDVSVSSTTVLVLTAVGEVWAWGDNAYGQAGIGSSPPPQTVLAPEPVTTTLGGPRLSGVVAIAAGRTHSMAVTSDGAVFVWGDNTYGYLGVGGTDNKPSPVEVIPARAGRSVVSVAGGWRFSLAVEDGGALWTWGYNWAGQLGVGDKTPRTSPELVQFGEVDSDGDGLTDNQELALVPPSDPNKADSNDDGIPDGAAWALWSPDATRLTDLDMDDDSLENSQELALGTSPFNPNTDGDQLPDGTDPYPLDPTRPGSTYTKPGAPDITLSLPISAS